MNGYKTVEDLTKFNNWTQSYRYKILKLEKDGQYYLLKQANDDFTKGLLGNEVRWREFFKSVDVDNVTNTEIVDIGEDYLLFRWVEAEVLAKPNVRSIKLLAENLDRYVDLLIAVRRAAKTYSPNENEVKTIKDESRFDAPLAYHERLKPLLAAGWINSKTVDDIQSLYSRYLPFASGGYQHGDFTPWHIFVQDGQWTIFDAEHATSLRSGYTDLSHSYVRVACRCKSPELAGRILGTYLQKAGEDVDEFKKKIMSELVKKAAGSLIDSYNDRDIADFRREATALLDKVLKDDLQALL